MDAVHSLTPPYILYTPRSRCRYPIGATVPRTQEVVPFPPGVETVRPPQHQPSLVPAPPNPNATPVPNDLHPHPEMGPSTKEGSTWFKRVHQPEVAQDETIPTPQ
ncbi:hypothetical protein ILYODFUR_039164 [Ilyodon furcidens]|uniref:Uncharacterized protein n=1 Tax=Ilyodon furcidens TaxID=33524 RepID=A0ABV0V9S0_9TELE